VAIPSDPQPRESARHIDTDVLRGMLDSTGKDDLHAVGKHLSNSTRKTDPLGVSIPAIGEAFHTLSESNQKVNSSTCGDAAIELRRLVQNGKLMLVGVGGSNEVYSIARDLTNSDDHLTSLDALILSVACLCKSCHTFYTSDSTLLNSISISEIAEEHDVRVLPPPSF